MKKNAVIWLLLSFAGMLAVFLWMRVQGEPLKTPQTPLAILNLEFAWNLEKANLVNAAWKDNRVPVALNNIYIDFLFVICYTAFLYFACSMLASKFNGGWQRTGYSLARLMPAAGIFDVAENALMLLTLQATPNNLTAMATTAFAVFKFALVILAVLYILTALVLRLLKR